MANRRLERWVSHLRFYKPVLWICDILERIRIRGPVALTYGSGSFSLVTFKMLRKNIFFLLIFVGTFTSVFKDKKSRRSHTKVEIKVFLTFFAWWWKDPDPRGTNIEGSGRPKNLWILLIRIHNMPQTICKRKRNGRYNYLRPDGNGDLDASLCETIFLLWENTGRFSGFLGALNRLKYWHI